MISETSSLLTGSVASAASRISLKESKVTIRDRKIVFWTPVMIWPTGFAKSYKRETVEYRSDERLHNGKYPYITTKMQGGVIIDLQTTAIEAQVSQLLDTNELLSDSELCFRLQDQLVAIRGTTEQGSGGPKVRAVNIFDTSLVKKLPTDKQFAIRRFLEERESKTAVADSRELRRRDRKASAKEAEVIALLQAKHITEALRVLKPIHISQLVGVSKEEVY